MYAKTVLATEEKHTHFQGSTICIFVLVHLFLTIAMKSAKGQENISNLGFLIKKPFRCYEILMLCHAKVNYYSPWLELVILKPRIGRRGLLNLGQTCYLNVVLQAFIHNPLLRNYFLSDTHNHKLCKIRDCVCCEMDKLFAEVIGSSESYSEGLMLDRFILTIPHPMGPFLFWHLLGGHPRS